MQMPKRDVNKRDGCGILTSVDTLMSDKLPDNEIILYQTEDGKKSYSCTAYERNGMVDTITDGGIISNNHPQCEYPYS